MTLVGMARGEWRVEKALRTGSIGADDDQQESRTQREVFEKIPE